MVDAVIGGIASVAGAALSGGSTGGSGYDKAAVEVQRDQLAFDKQQYADWKAVYGDIQTNIGNYYKTLTPDKLTALGLQKSNEAYQAAKTQINRELAQKGIDPASGLSVGVNAGLAINNAVNRAGIRTNAPQAVIDAKTGFLSIGLGQGAQLAGNIGQTSRGISGTLQNQAQRNAQQNLVNQTQRNNFITTGIDNFTTAVGAYVGGQ